MILVHDTSVSWEETVVVGITPYRKCNDSLNALPGDMIKTPTIANLYHQRKNVLTTTTTVTTVTTATTITTETTRTVTTVTTS